MNTQELDLTEWLDDDGRPDAGEEFTYGGQSHTFVRMLGEGSFGKTFHVAVRDGVDLVFKIFKDQSQAVVREIKKEFDRANLLGSQHCAKMVKLLRNYESVVGFAYEYIEGTTLERMIDRPTEQPSAEAIRRLCLDLFLALESLHVERWVHKDVKPANIIILPDGRGVNLIDFGLLTPVGNGTRVGAGTPQYMAPEAVAASNANDQFDLYGACASLLELIVGRSTFDSCFTRQGPAHAHMFLGLAATDLSQLEPLLRNLAHQLAKGLAVNPLDRPRSVTELIDLVQQVTGSAEPEGIEVDSSAVRGLLSLRKGSAGVLPQDSHFAKSTQVDTRLYSELVPRLIAGEFEAVFLSGNPGDGKTTFLNSLLALLAESGGVVLQQSDKDWVVEKGDLTIHAMLDASESDGEISSDERIATLLKKISRPGNVAVLAINDGRIDSFMRSYSDEFSFAIDVQDQLRGKSPRNSRIAVIDLKKRALIPSGEDNSRGLGAEILLSLTEPNLWTECERCISREVCPILDNKTRIRRDLALDGIERLLSISHYRREQRATFRDIRSVFAYLITGDRDCNSVHSARRDGRDLRRAERSLFYDLAFVGPVGDHLLASWQTIDPARLPLAEVARRVITRDRAVTALSEKRTVASFARESFFGANESWFGQFDHSEWNVYRYFDQFQKELRGESGGHLPQILRGLSRLLGATSLHDRGLAIPLGDREASWKVQREFELSRFKLEVERNDGSFVEVAADSLRLVFQSEEDSETFSRVEMLLSLDDFELIMRSDAGEVINDVYSRAVIAKFMGFASRLRLRETSTVTLIGPSSEIVTAMLSGTKIEMSIQ